MYVSISVSSTFSSARYVIQAQLTPTLVLVLHPVLLELFVELLMSDGFVPLAATSAVVVPVAVAPAATAPASAALASEAL